MKKQTWQQWIRVVCADAKKNPNHPSKLRNGCLAPCTGTDYRALNAFVACIELYAYTCNQGALEAASLVLREMQESTRWIARELIPFVMDWGYRERLWPKIVGSVEEEPDAVPYREPTRHSNCGADWDER